jgi:deazaflavin-dependent oxidoreductase (nitroreductase family)
MGLMHDLGLEVRHPNPLQRAIQQLVSTRAGAWLTSKALHPVDKVLFKASRGRLTAASLLAATPVIMVTTKGAKSGRERTTPLIGIPLGAGLALIGTNFAQKPTPGWVYNLEADPSATIAYRERAVAVTARPADASEADQVFALSRGVYGGYNTYRARVDHRPIRVFILEQAA